MIKIEFVQEDGTSQTVEAQAGITLMEAARTHGVEGIVADCGGSCACATCHVHVEQPWFDALPARGADEVEMLDFAKGVDDHSRLACQIALFDGLDGMRVHIPANQY